MNDILDPLLDATSKGFPHGSAPLRRSAIGTQGWNVLAGDLPLPLAVVKRDALQHNLGWMQRYADDAGVRFAPHGKTTMSPQLFRRQLDAGAWGLTFATVAQLRIGVEAGARRCLIANQVFDAGDLSAIATLQREHADLRVLFLLDSPAQLELIEAAHPQRPFEVLLEIGVPGGRTGCRTFDDALALARRARASAALRLAGIECYEGLGAKGDSEIDRANADALMQRVTEIALQCDREKLFEADEVIVSAGGSAIFDLVVPALKTGAVAAGGRTAALRLLRHARPRLLSPHGRGGEPAPRLRQGAAGRTRSLGARAVAARAGARDPRASAGATCPTTSSCRSRSARAARGSRDVQAAPADWKISGLNDQHAYLRFDGDPGLAVGDRDRPRHLAPVHDLRQVALDAGGGCRLPRRRCARHLLLRSRWATDHPVLDWGASE